MQNPATVSTAPVADLAALPAATPTRRWRTEDWIAVVLGFLVITTVLLRVPVEGRGPAQRRADLPLDHRQPDRVADAGLDRQRSTRSRATPRPSGSRTSWTLSKGLRDALASQDRKAIEDGRRQAGGARQRTLAGRARRARSAAMRPRSPRTRVFTWATTCPRCSTSASASSSWRRSGSPCSAGAWCRS